MERKLELDLAYLDIINYRTERNIISAYSLYLLKLYFPKISQLIL